MFVHKSLYRILNRLVSSRLFFDFTEIFQKIQIKSVMCVKTGASVSGLT